MRSMEIHASEEIIELATLPRLHDILQRDEIRVESMKRAVHQPRAARITFVIPGVQRDDV
ncbi:MAG TPA: hypothetical protein VHA53_03085 [Nitrolancea sp.]|nr:hypothetical protein [Nitrolancea sp.]